MHLKTTLLSLPLAVAAALANASNPVEVTVAPATPLIEQGCITTSRARPASMRMHCRRPSPTSNA
ncbi:hypothetical protein [Massilia sp. DD77]|uniref:hypothetical protein n=1 Tax=Massilia sp. DD77 TaxID=3109349 RepID=UPI002FFEE556